MVIAIIIISNDNNNNSNKVDLQTEKHHRKKNTKKQTNKLDLCKIFVRKTRKEIISLLMSQTLNGNVKDC